MTEVAQHVYCVNAVGLHCKSKI